MNDSANHDKLGKATLVSAAILALPPALAFLAAAFPGYVPIPFVDITDPAAARPALIAAGLVLLLLNAGVLFLLRSFLSQRA